MNEIQKGERIIGLQREIIEWLHRPRANNKIQS